MLIFEQLVSRGLMAFDPKRNVLAFNLPVIARLPVIADPLLADGRESRDDPKRNVLAFNLPVIARFPAIRQERIGEFKWMIGDWAFENHVRATPTTPAYTDTYYYTYELADSGSRYM